MTQQVGAVKEFWVNGIGCRQGGWHPVSHPPIRTLPLLLVTGRLMVWLEVSLGFHHIIVFLCVGWVENWGTWAVHEPYITLNLGF